MMSYTGPIELIADALSKAQGEFPPLTMDKEVSYNGVRFEYASLGNMIHATREILAKHKLSVLQFPDVTDGQVTIETMILHSSGQFILSKMSGKSAKPNDPKDIGSLISYYRRYSYGSVLGLSLDGDYDAEVISVKYIGSQDQKGWLRDVLTPMGVDTTVMGRVHEIMMRGNFEMTEESVAKALEALRK